MARPRSAGFEEQRDQILQAAAQLFANGGYAGTTMQQVARASSVSKATLYHYVQDKHDLLAQISAGHVARLIALVAAVKAHHPLPAKVPEMPSQGPHLTRASGPGAALSQAQTQTQAQTQAQTHLTALIESFMQVYAKAQHQHRVLTEDIKFLHQEQRDQVQQAQRLVVQAFADAVAALRPELVAQSLHKPLAMLLFGMMNWTFTWLRPDGALSHQSLAPVLTQLFLGGVQAVDADLGAVARPDVVRQSPAPWPGDEPAPSRR